MIPGKKGKKKKPVARLFVHKKLILLQQPL